jgi:hypothetical protein
VGASGFRGAFFVLGKEEGVNTEDTEEELGGHRERKRERGGKKDLPKREQRTGKRSARGNWLPGSLHCAARRAGMRAKKRSGRSGRDDGVRKREPQENIRSTPRAQAGVPVPHFNC